MNLRILFLPLLILFGLCVTAQTQPGYVKTIGKRGQKGQALSGVTVRVKGEHNAVVSKTDGTFLMPMPGKKNGQPYTLQQVQKNGYELNEKTVIGRQYAFSSTVPLTIVMVSSAQLQADKQRIENNAYKTAEKSYKAKMAQLEKQMKEKSISEEQYRAELQELQDKFERYQTLIDELAEHYAHTDYDELDEKEAEINILIENGELEKADSLIHTLFDPVDVLKRNKEALTRLDQTIAGAQGLLDQANADMAAVLRQQEKDAEHLYQLYSIALAQFDNEKASRYIQTRAELDTTNVEWQNDAGLFVNDYLADFPVAMKYFQRALTQATRQYGEQSAQVATCYSYIGIAVLQGKSDFNEALDCFAKAHGIREQVLGPDHQETAQSLANIGLVNGYLGNYDKALDMLLKAIPVIENALGKHPYTATMYNNVGLIYKNRGEPAKALEYYYKSLELNESLLGPDHFQIGLSHNNMGSAYKDMKDYDKALEHHFKALEIFKKSLGDNHPVIAMSLNNIAVVHGALGHHADEIDYFTKALAILERVYGPEHAQTAMLYRNLGDVHREAAEYDEALADYFKTLKVYESLLGTCHDETAYCYYNIGMSYEAMGNHSNALVYLNKAYTALKTTHGPDDPSLKTVKELIEAIQKFD